MLVRALHQSFTPGRSLLTASTDPGGFQREMARHLAARGSSPAGFLEVVPAANRTTYGFRQPAGSYPNAPWHNETPQAEVESTEGSDADPTRWILPPIALEVRSVRLSRSVID